MLEKSLMFGGPNGLRRGALVVGRGVFAVGLCLIGGFAGLTQAQATSPATTLSLAAQAGQKLFFDTNLSGSKKMSCATCHDPTNHYAQPASNKQPVQFGGSNLSSPGIRAVPTLTYKLYNPPYNDSAINPDGVSTNAPGGGFTWDGHADTQAQQSAIPLLSSFEMDNASEAAVVAVVQNASYAALFEQAYGVNVFNDTETAFTDVGLALQAYQQEDPSFNAFTSKYDYWATLSLSNGQPVNLTPAEVRGYTVFNYTGNCFACHYNGPQTGGGGAIFTDYTYENASPPRNTNIPANSTKFPLPTHYDLGLCTAVNPDPANPYLIPHVVPGSAEWCGSFKTPTLRNTATRNVFFHNGVFTSLAEVIDFYNTRDTDPGKWYPTVGGVIQKFNDLPTAYKAYVDNTDVPFGLSAGDTPYMTAQNEADLVCFLETLTDGYVQGVTPQDPHCVN
jgi:cytochrome c peroxidase